MLLNRFKVIAHAVTFWGEVAGFPCTQHERGIRGFLLLLKLPLFSDQLFWKFSSLALAKALCFPSISEMVATSSNQTLQIEQLKGTDHHRYKVFTNKLGFSLVSVIIRILTSTSSKSDVLAQLQLRRLRKPASDCGCELFKAWLALLSIPLLDQPVPLLLCCAADRIL